MASRKQPASDSAPASAVGAGAKALSGGIACGTVRRVNALIEQSKDDLERLCRRFKVRRLALFGSANTGGFKAESSDLYFLVTLEDQPPGDYAHCYLELANALEQLFGRRVDLVTEASIRNPYFRQSVEATQELVYENRDQEAAA
jgi:hypothetical protein